MKAVIMAGGKGTRLSSITHDEIPKSMVLVCGKPILEHQIRLLIRYGIEEVIIIAGILHEKIETYFRNGNDFDIPIKYIVEDKPLGTGGALHILKKEIHQDFLLIFGDLILDISVPKMVDKHTARKAIITLFAHPNSHPYDSDLLILDKENWVTGYYAKKEPRQNFYQNIVNAGLYVINPSLFTELPDKEKIDFENDIVFPLCGKHHAVFAYTSPEYVKDVGTPERLQAAEHDMKSFIIETKNIDRPQRCIFLDRDGTLNKYNDLIWKPEQLELEEGAGEAVKAINESGYLAVLVTNQPVVARGLCAEDDVDSIHNKLETLLGEHGAYLDAIIYCPHHPDKGYEGENPKYKIWCRCRKPEIGMIEDCVNRFNLDLEKSFMIGDSTVDIQTGKNAGMRTVLVKTGQSGLDGKYTAKPDWICADVKEAVQMILKSEGRNNEKGLQ